MPTFAVELVKIRLPTAYIDAKDWATAIRKTRRTWREVGHGAPLPFDLRTAKLMPPAGVSPIPSPSAPSVVSVGMG